MAEKTNIEWADSTANLWIGCTNVSPGCDNCYAERDWQDRKHRVEWGPHGDRSYCKAGWAVIEKMQRRAANNRGLDPELGRKRRIFVNSLSDFFDNHKSVVWRDEAFDLFEASPDVILMLVTKRPENVAKMVPAHWLNGGWPKNVWLLVSIEDQERADHRIPILLSIPGVPVRGLSCEPLLGPVEVWTREIAHLAGEAAYDARIGWVICGGESGPGARDNDFLANARSLLAQCQATDTPFFGKQGYRKQPLPDDLNVREFPN